MNERVVKELVQARKSVKRKFESLRSDIAQSQLETQAKFKPITEPLQQLITSLKNEPISVKTEKIEPSFKIYRPQAISTPQRNRPPEFLRDEFVGSSDNESDEVPDVSLGQLQHELTLAGTTPEYENYLKQFQGLARMYIDGFFKDTAKEYDQTYGVYLDDKSGKWKVGNSVLNFEGEDLLLTVPSGETFKYTGTPGLYELLFKKEPLSSNNDKDKINYKDLLIRSSVIYQKHNPNNPKLAVTKKYREVIKPILDARKPSLVRQISSRTVASKKGSGTQLRFNNKKLEFIPWNDPNQLVNWLRKLMRSQSAGHTGHDNEITYIIDELRSANIIK